MATIAQKIEAEHRVRTLLEDHGLPEPDEVEYGHTCIRLFFQEPKLCLVVDIDEPPDGWLFADGIRAHADPDEEGFDFEHSDDEN